MRVSSAGHVEVIQCRLVRHGPSFGIAHPGTTMVSLEVLRAETPDTVVGRYGFMGVAVTLTIEVVSRPRFATPLDFAIVSPQLLPDARRFAASLTVVGVQGIDTLTPPRGWPALFFTVTVRSTIGSVRSLPLAHRQVEEAGLNFVAVRFASGIGFAA
jgi:hypothetical protein